MGETVLAHCRAAVEECNAELGWGLSTPELARYVIAIRDLCDDNVDHGTLRTVVVNYHLDHGQVAALRDAGHPEHERAWARWMDQILACLRRAGLGWSSDIAVDAEDLAQMARLAVSRDLSSYRYQSRLGRWVQQVAVRCVQRHLRDSMAQKRAARPASLDADPAVAPPIPDAAHPEVEAHGLQLAALVAEVLADHPDGRLGTIFRLWAVEDRRVAEIGGLLRLHPSRVRALLQQARGALQAHPAIRSWARDESLVAALPSGQAGDSAPDPVL